jgi:hypothetical protein
MAQPVQTVQLATNGLSGVIQGLFGTYVPLADGTIQADSRDVIDLIRAGMTYVNKVTRTMSFSIAPATASATVYVANVAATNVALTIAAQPDVVRPFQAVFAPGAAAVTAGTLTVVYTGNDGITHTDVFSLVTGSGVSLTPNSSKACAHITSATIAGIAGGSSPTIQIGSTAALGLVCDPGFQGFAVQKENDGSGNATVGTVNAGQGAIAPTAAPNATRTYEFTYSYIAPGV